MQFTKELLKHSASYDVSTLERILKEKKEVEIKKRDLEKEKNELKLYQLIQRQRVVEETIPLFPKQKKHKKKTIVMRAPLPKLPQLKIPRATPHQLPLSELNIPYNQLPPELQHITPVPSKESLELVRIIKREMKFAPPELKSFYKRAIRFMGYKASLKILGNQLCK